MAVAASTWDASLDLSFPILSNTDGLKTATYNFPLKPREFSNPTHHLRAHRSSCYGPLTPAQQHLPTKTQRPKRHTLNA